MSVTPQDKRVPPTLGGSQVSTPASASRSLMFHLMQGVQFTSFGEQSIYEIGKLITFVSYYEEPHVVLGDFNTGPASTMSNDFMAEYEGHYKMLTDDLETQLVTSCTFCSNNPYVDGHPSVAIDHIFTRNHYSPMNVDRVMDVETVPSSGLPLSNHYGVNGTINVL